jgi:hypothetical protein
VTAFGIGYHQFAFILEKIAMMEQLAPPWQFFIHCIVSAGFSLAHILDTTGQLMESLLTPRQMAFLEFSIFRLAGESGMKKKKRNGDITGMFFFLNALSFWNRNHIFLIGSGVVRNVAEILDTREAENVICFEDLHQVSVIKVHIYDTIFIF